MFCWIVEQTFTSRICRSFLSVVLPESMLLFCMRAGVSRGEMHGLSNRCMLNITRLPICLSVHLLHILTCLSACMRTLQYQAMAIKVLVLHTVAAGEEEGLSHMDIKETVNNHSNHTLKTQPKATTALAFKPSAAPATSWAVPNGGLVFYPRVYACTYAHANVCTHTHMPYSILR